MSTLRRKVVLDPGHGGRDPGAVGHGLCEDIVALDISRRVAELLNKREDTEASLTRQELNLRDELGLWERCEISDALQADCFVSVHCNAAESASAYGSETFFYRYSHNGMALARSIQNGINRYCPEVPERRVEGKGFYVLANTQAPAALVECGFVTNSVDAAALKDNEFKDRMAKAIAEGIVRWLWG